MFLREDTPKMNGVERKKNFGSKGKIHGIIISYPYYYVVKY